MRFAIPGLLLCTLAALAEEPDGIERGRALLDGPRHAEGVALIRAALAELARQPDKDAAALHRTGLGYFYLGEDVRAAAAFREAMASAPGDPEHRFMLAVVLLYSDLPGAEREMRATVAMAPAVLRYRMELGRILHLQEKTGEALACYLKAAELAPDEPAPLVRAADLLADLGRAEEALAAYAKALALDAADVHALYNRGQLLYNLGQFEKAHEAWLAVTRLAPEDFGAHKKVLQALYALGRYDEAAPVREKLLALRAASGDPGLRGLEEFCFDQFAAGPYRVFAFERFEKEGDLYDHFVFRVVDAEGNQVRTVDLESSAVIREMGYAYILGGHEGDTHVTYGPCWKALPAYAELKALVVRAAQGELEAGASSRPGGD